MLPMIALESARSPPYQPGITMAKSVQAGISPNQAICILKAGNERFIAGKPLSRNQKTPVSQIPPYLTQTLAPLPV